MAASFLHDYPDLRPFLLPDARPTGRTIGLGSYGSVEEVAIPGALCAAKKIHNFLQDPARVSLGASQAASREFLRQCQQLSVLRHPHVVLFLGVCFLPGSRLPVLVSEKLVTNLHDVLAPDPLPTAKSEVIPLGLKVSILHNVASGLSFLHSRSPPVVHGYLTAKNVLLNEGMVAKIGDLGIAQVLCSLQSPSMVNTLVYLPPEALEDESRSDTAIDVFALGVVALFTISQIFPKPLAATYVNKSKQVVGRTEIERRQTCMEAILSQLSKEHPLVLMVQHCLKNHGTDRPTIQQVSEQLEPSRANIGDGGNDVNKLTFAWLLQSKDDQIDQQQQDIEAQKGEIQAQKEKIEAQNKRIEAQNKKIDELQIQISSCLSAEMAVLKVHNS